LLKVWEIKQLKRYELLKVWEIKQLKRYELLKVWEIKQLKRYELLKVWEIISYETFPNCYYYISTYLKNSRESSYYYSLVVDYNIYLQMLDGYHWQFDLAA
jgi:hypothetical protein